MKKEKLALDTWRSHSNTGETFRIPSPQQVYLRTPMCQGQPEKGAGLEIPVNMPMKTTHKKERLLCWHLPYTLLDSDINRT